MEHFTGDRAAALPKGEFSFGQRELFRSRRNRRRALENRLREATYAEVAFDRMME